MKGFLHARAGGAGGGSKPAPPAPPPTTLPDLPPPASPFETSTSVPTREGEHTSHVIAWSVIGALGILVALTVAASIYNRFKKK